MSELRTAFWRIARRRPMVAFWWLYFSVREWWLSIVSRLHRWSGRVLDRAGA